MTPQEKLIHFMEEKQECLQCVNGDFPEIITDKDEDSIRKWSDSECREVLEYVQHKIYYHMTDNSHVSDMDICVFCIYHKKMRLSRPKCENCEWGFEHGYCLKNERNDYNDTIEMIEVLSRHEKSCIADVLLPEYGERLLSILENKECE